jgi:Ni/Co efflux regulator RcnB
MRKFLLLILLASAATPAVAAQDQDNTSNRRAHRAERAQSDNDAPRREAPVARPRSEPRETDNRAFGGDAEATHSDAPPVERVQRGSAGDTVRSGRQDFDTSFEQRVRKSETHPTLPERPTTERRNVTEQGDTVRNWRRVERDGSGSSSTIQDHVRTAPGTREGGLVEPRRPLPRVLTPTERRVSRTPVFGTEPPEPRTARGLQANPSHRWDHNWRHDRRYDWNDWRQRHRSRFHIGFYYDPFGWDYFRYGIGWRLWPSYYGSSFWLNDPSYYRLPPAYGPYRWIRYHNDALLVNIYTGSVVDVIYDFFW